MVAEQPIPQFGTDELRRLEVASGWLCTCHEGYTSQMCPFHATRIPLPEIQIRRGGITFEKGCSPVPCPSFQDATLEVTATSELDQLAARAYAAYARTFDGSTFMGQPFKMLPYDELAESAKIAWRAAARQVMDDM